MALLRRSRTAVSPSVDLEELAKPGGKNRPTPKRREAIASRPVAPYMKGASGSSRERRAADREARRASYTQQREGLRSGDPKRLPARDQGPERAVARDVVDSRRSVLGLFLYFAGVSLLLGFVRQRTVADVTSLLLPAVFLLSLGDAILLGRAATRAVRERVPGGGTQPVRFYAVQRAVMPRRFRLPPPRVRPGDPI